MANGNLKLAVQKKGRLSDKTLELLKLCGLDIETYSERLLITAGNFSIDLLFLRDDDIPEYVQDGVADIGIVGENIVFENNADVNIIEKLGFGGCKLMIAAPEEKLPSCICDLNSKTIATSHPRILQKYLDDNKINAKIINISGSVEIAPALGVADMICDIVSTGATLMMNKLKKSFMVFESEAVLIGTKGLYLNEKKLAILLDLQTRIRSVQAARNSKYLMMNIPTGSLETITKIIPSLKSPTVLPLADGKSLAVHAVIPAQGFWNIVNDLKAAGASGILLLQIDNMII